MLADCHFHPLDMGERYNKESVFQGAGASAHPRQWPALREWSADSGAPRVLGIHPWAVQSDPSANAARLTELHGLLSDARCRPAAVGEIGLDKARGKENFQEQLEVFRRQAEWAGELGLPIVLHCVRAYAETAAVLKESRFLRGGPAAEGRAGLVHGFWGSAEICREWLRMGFFISINPKFILRACSASEPADNPWRVKLAALAAVIPSDRLLLESDAPWGLSEPAEIEKTAACLSGLRSEGGPEIIGVCSENLRRLFGLS